MGNEPHCHFGEYKELIAEALKEYQTGETMSFKSSVAMAFAGYMLEQIRGK